MRLSNQPSCSDALSQNGKKYTKSSRILMFIICYLALMGLTSCWFSEKQTSQSVELDSGVPISSVCSAKNINGESNIIEAEVVALEQIITYNRFGAFNPASMIYALRQDIVKDDGSAIPDNLSDQEMAALAGRVKLKAGKRPRPLVLRVHEEECLRVKFWNFLAPVPFENKTFERSDFPKGGVQRSAVAENLPNQQAKFTDLSSPPQDAKQPNSFAFPAHEEEDFPVTRAASIHVNGLEYLAIRPQACEANNSTNKVLAECNAETMMGSDGANVGKNASSLVAPGKHTTYLWYARQEGGYFIYSDGALAGGEGDGGQLGLGLFGAINVEPKGSIWYRSQVTNPVLEAANPKHNYAELDYAALAILKGRVIQHSDLNAIIYQTQDTSETPSVCSKRSPGSSCGLSFREFTTIFHDENKVFQAFAELEDESNPISAIGDGMAINYGASGVGSAVLANAKKLGPGKDCPECKLEEFFLSSWVNGDPAMIVRRNAAGDALEALYPDDPSNVHHAYLGDPVRFRNIHAGPKETHVFHLHAHQWLQDKNDPNANYLDSQTISPGSSYTYDIQYGGGGNRNLTPGDAIFHCHLYPHFAAGMWELWRNHDVFEDGSLARNLPDYEIKNGTPNPAIIPIPGVPLAPLPTAEFPGYPFYIAGKAGHRPPQPPLDIAYNANAQNPADQWLDGGLPRHIITGGSLKAHDVNNPQEVAKLLRGLGDENENKAARYIAKRTWQLNSDPNNLALARKMDKAELQFIPQCGTKSEILAMAYHSGWTRDELLGLKRGSKPHSLDDTLWQACQKDFQKQLATLADDFKWEFQLAPQRSLWPANRLLHQDSKDDSSPLIAMHPLWEGAGYQTPLATQPKSHPAAETAVQGKQFRVNGFAPAPGAPYADPCPAQYYPIFDTPKPIFHHKPTSIPHSINAKVQNGFCSAIIF